MDRSVVMFKPMVSDPIHIHRKSPLPRSRKIGSVEVSVYVPDNVFCRKQLLLRFNRTKPNVILLLVIQNQYYVMFQKRVALILLEILHGSNLSEGIYFFKKKKILLFYSKTYFVFSF